LPQCSIEILSSSTSVDDNGGAYNGTSDKYSSVYNSASDYHFGGGREIRSVLVMQYFI
jgi:hypothetical protein